MLIKKQRFYNHFNYNLKVQNKHVFVVVGANLLSLGDSQRTMDIQKIPKLIPRQGEMMISETRNLK
jgi:hypothetical protein